MNFHYIVPMGIVLKYATNEDLISAFVGEKAHMNALYWKQECSSYNIPGSLKWEYKHALNHIRMKRSIMPEK